MRFRTRLFLIWVALTLALWGGAYWAIRRSVEQSFDRMSDETFVGINRGLRHLCMERVSSMRQACQLVANIPELRALIAEQNYELVPENQANLRERLDNLSQVVGATFVCALNDAGKPVAQNKNSPWSTLTDLHQFLQKSDTARLLIAKTFQPPDAGQFGLWVYQGRLYQIAAVPLVFQSSSRPGPQRPEGALLMGKQLNDAFSIELGKSYGCEITFLADGRIAASSLAQRMQEQLIAKYRDVASSPAVLTELGGVSYRAAFELLVDPCSQTTVGTIVVQHDQAQATSFLWQLWRNLVFIIAGGIVAAAVVSFLLSLAITRPVNALVAGVRGVAQGNFNLSFKVSGRDELGELANAFNDMVSQIRRSREELQRLLDEARKGAQREHLLHEVAQQINQRLDVQSSLSMFITSVSKLFPDILVEVFRYESERQMLRALDHHAPDGESPPAHDFQPRILPVLSDPRTVERLQRHELVYLPDVPPATVPAALVVGPVERCSTCLVPMRGEQRFLGTVTATRRRADGFGAEEREFLQALADHFAIALANAQVHEELRKAYQDLRANQLQIIQTERLRALGQMASGIAHDFNNHLTGVLAFLEMALDRSELSAEVREWLKMSRDSSLAAADVVKLLRNFYRKDNSDALVPVDFNKLAAITISLTRPRWSDMTRQHGILVTMKEDFDKIGYVLGNEPELRDALTNLLFNAVDALPQGGEITVRTRQEDQEVIVEVQDTGTGMSEDVRRQCLEPFFTTKGSQGTGLGLSMVHGVAGRHQGRLTIKSERGVGTTIRLSFPRAKPHQVPQAEAPKVAGGASRRILCVDDDVRILKSLEGMLRQLGHEVSTTSTGAEAIDRLATGQFNVLITDLGMPGMDGRQVAQNAKRVSPNTAVLLLTGWADRLAAEGEMPEGVDRILGKPITKAQLQEAVTAHHPSQFVTDPQRPLRATGVEKSQNAALPRCITMDGCGPTGSRQPSQEPLA